MRAFEILTEAEAVPATKKVGREFNHLEDLVFIDPENGAVRAVEILRSLERGAKDVAVKWDGYPTMYWGRDQDGTFILTGKNGWGRNKTTSADDLADFILSTGKGEEWREKFAGDMAALWPIFESATPKDFRGFVYADILFHPGRPAQSTDGSIVFTPNKVTYTVNTNSEVGAKLAGKKAAVAATAIFNEFGSKQGKPFDGQDIFQGDVAVLGQTYVDHKPEVDLDNIDSLAQKANSVQSRIKEFFAPRKGLANIQEIFYRYVNYMGKQRRLDDLSKQTFLNYLEAAEAKLTDPKRQRVLDLAQEFVVKNDNIVEDITDDIISLVRQIMSAKDEVIRELDAAEGDVMANIGSEKGGEGYVIHSEKVKLVPRKRFTLN